MKPFLYIATALALSPAAAQENPHLSNSAPQNVHQPAPVSPSSGQQTTSCDIGYSSSCEADVVATGTAGQGVSARDFSAKTKVRFHVKRTAGNAYDDTYMATVTFNWGLGEETVGPLPYAIGTTHEVESTYRYANPGYYDVGTTLVFDGIYEDDAAAACSGKRFPTSSKLLVQSAPANCEWSDYPQSQLSSQPAFEGGETATPTEDGQSGSLPNAAVVETPALTVEPSAQSSVGTQQSTGETPAQPTVSEPSSTAGSGVETVANPIMTEGQDGGTLQSTVESSPAQQSNAEPSTGGALQSTPEMPTQSFEPSLSSPTPPECTTTMCACPTNSGTCPPGIGTRMGNCCVHGSFEGSSNTEDDFYFTLGGLEYKCSDMPACPAELPMPGYVAEEQQPAVGGFTDSTTTNDVTVTESYTSNTDMASTSNTTESEISSCYIYGEKVPCDQIDSAGETDVVEEEEDVDPWADAAEGDPWYDGAMEGASSGVTVVFSSASMAFAVTVAAITAILR